MDQIVLPNFTNSQGAQLINGNNDDTLPTDAASETSDSLDRSSAFGATRLSLGIIWHPNPELIGAIAPLHFGRNETTELSRINPEFKSYNNSSSTPLLDPHISRTPVKIKRLGTRRFSFSCEKPIQITVNGRSAIADTIFDMDELGDEIVICLAQLVVISLFNAPARQVKAEAHGGFGLVGISNAMSLTRDAIQRIAVTDIPVLVRGETGTGKELVAQGLYKASGRSTGALVAVNMSTIAQSLASVELFGAKKGAFTGSIESNKGLFEQAERGVLFLDEIGDTPKEVQPMLLRAIEQKEIKRVGDDKLRKLDVRIIAATDRSLEADSQHPSFNQPLLRRLEGASIFIAPLRRRRIDIGILVCHFIENENAGYPGFPLSEISARQMTELALYDWPGNVRELKNVVQKLRLGQKTFDQNIMASVRSKQNDQSFQPKKAGPKFVNPHDIDEDTLLDALDSCDWVIKKAAKKLNVSRTSLYAVMARSPTVRNIDEIPVEEIISTIQSCPGGLSVWAKELRVGKDSLRKKMKGIAILNR